MFCKEIHSTYIGENVTVWFPWNISIGKSVSINNGCCLDGTGGIIIKDNTRVALSYTVGTGNPYRVIKERGSTKQKCEDA